MLTDRLDLSEAENSLGLPVPTRDVTIQINRENRMIPYIFYEGSETRLQFVSLLFHSSLFGDVFHREQDRLGPLGPLIDSPPTQKQDSYSDRSEIMQDLKVVETRILWPDVFKQDA